MNDNLTWDDHVTSICAKSAKRLHFLKLLKRSAMSADDLLHYYKSVIRPVTEYSCFVWHSSLTKEQANRLENVQRRAVRLIFGNNNQDMNSAMSSLTSLADRREHLAKHFFEGLAYFPQQTVYRLHHLLPSKRNLNVISKFRRP